MLPAPADDIGASRPDTPTPYQATVANWLYRGWDFDRVYAGLFIKPYLRLARTVDLFDRVVVDGFYLVGATVARGLHAMLARTQDGRVSRYAMVMLAGAAAAAMVLWLGWR